MRTIVVVTVGILLGGLAYVAGSASADAPSAAHALDAAACTRPLCPYPQEAQYKGAGSPDAAENFVCRMP